MREKKKMRREKEGTRMGGKENCVVNKKVDEGGEKKRKITKGRTDIKTENC